MHTSVKFEMSYTICIYDIYIYIYVSLSMVALNNKDQHEKHGAPLVDLMAGKQTDRQSDEKWKL